MVGNINDIENDIPTMAYNPIKPSIQIADRTKILASSAKNINNLPELIKRNIAVPTKRPTVNNTNAIN